MSLPLAPFLFSDRGLRELYLKDNGHWIATRRVPRDSVELEPFYQVLLRRDIYRLRPPDSSYLNVSGGSDLPMTAVNCGALPVNNAADTSVIHLQTESHLRGRCPLHYPSGALVVSDPY